MKTKEKLWTMPEWMEQYRPFINNTGGNSVEDLMNSDADMRTNMPLAVLSMIVKGEVALLRRLHDEGKLNA